MDIQSLINKLNFMLKNDFEESVFMQLVKSLKDDFSLEVRMLDFSKSNEIFISELIKKKLHYIQNGQYEIAAQLRDEEREATILMDFKNALKVTETIFILEDDCVFYCHVGNLKNDELILKYFEIRSA